MLRNIFFNFLYLATFLLSSSSFAQCIYNRYGHKLCTGDQVIETTYGSENLRNVLISDIDYNVLTIRYKNTKTQINPDNLIGLRDCTYFESTFCEPQKVEVKEECTELSGKFVTKELYYNDYVLIENKSIFKRKQEIIKSECLVLKDK